ncbi:MAG TPA: hypothetical protein VH135_04625 [Steroidobacteraceae bacterium]|nr:hypothetical protein [Steroidobacteraceae bacterium]
MLNATRTNRLGSLVIALLCAALPLARLSADEAPSAAGPAPPAAQAPAEAERTRLQEVIVTADRTWHGPAG